MRGPRVLKRPDRWPVRDRVRDRCSTSGVLSSERRTGRIGVEDDRRADDIVGRLCPLLLDRAAPGVRVHSSHKLVDCYLGL